MSSDPRPFLLIETSPLISVLKISRFDLLEIYGMPLACTDFVRAEVVRQKVELDTLIAGGRIREIPLVEIAHLAEVETLRRSGYGRGEGSTIILAASEGYTIVIDDLRAGRLAASRGVRLLSTADVIVKNIQQGLLTLAEADVFLGQWRAMGEHPVSPRLSSFQDLLGSS